MKGWQGYCCHCYYCYGDLQSMLAVYAQVARNSPLATPSNHACR